MRFQMLAALMVAMGLQPFTGAARADETLAVAGADLLPVLRESEGTHEAQEVLRPLGKLRVTLESGQQVEMEPSWFSYLGDMHIRLVFDGPQLHSAVPQDLARLHLAPEQALELAVRNLRRTYGEPTVQPWSGALMQVHGRADDLNSSYFLDRAFWRRLEAAHPGGLVVAVPRRGGLVYAPHSDAEAVAQLRFGAVALYASGQGRRLSSALYLFKDGQWSVYQPAITHRPVAPVSTSR